MQVARERDTELLAQILADSFAMRVVIIRVSLPSVRLTNKIPTRNVSHSPDQIDPNQLSGLLQGGVNEL